MALMLRIACDLCPHYWRVVNSNHPGNLSWLSDHLRDNPSHHISVTVTQHPNEQVQR